MEQGDLMDLIASSRDEAIDRVETHANREWKEVAYLTAIEVGKRQGTFTSEDVWDAISGVTTHEPRAMGAVMRRLRKENIIMPTDTFVISTSPLGHGRPSRVWRFIRGGEQQALENNDRPVTDRCNHDWYYYNYTPQSARCSKCGCTP